MSILEMIHIILVIPFLFFCLFGAPIILCTRLPTLPVEEYRMEIEDCLEMHVLGLLGYIFAFLPFAMEETLVGSYWKKFSVRNQELHLLPYEDNDK